LAGFVLLALALTPWRSPGRESISRPLHPDDRTCRSVINWSESGHKPALDL
jgi:hypothetical protein